MPRPHRICLPNTTYHVYSRCIEKREMLLNDYFKDIFIDVTRMTLEKYEFEFISYQIMDNHFHFIIKTTKNGPNISRIMQYIKARFAEKYNKIFKRTGPFWNERFKDKIIEFVANPKNYLLNLLWYLAYNPVRKNLIKNPREYKYGSINSYLDETYKPPIKITLHDFFIQLGRSFGERVQKFMLYNIYGSLG